MDTNILDITCDNLGSVLHHDKEKPLQNPLGAISNVVNAIHAIGKLQKIPFQTPPQFSFSTDIEDQIDRIARFSGVNYRILSFHNLSSTISPIPLLGFYGKERNPVILILEKGGVSLIDPETQKSRLLSEEDRNNLEDKVYQFYCPIPESQQLSLWEIVKISCKRNWRETSTILTTGLFVTLVLLIFPLANKVLFDDILSTYDLGLIVQVSLGLVVATLASTIFTLAQRLTISRLQTVNLNEIQMGIWGRIFSLSNSILKKFTVGEIFERIHYFEHFQQFVSEQALTILLNGVFSLFYLGLMFFFSVPLALGSLIIMAIAILLAFPIVKLYLVLFNQFLAIDNKLVSTVIQFIRGIYTIRSTRSQNQFFAAWSNIFIPSQQLKKRLGFREMSFILLSSLTPLAVTLIIYLIAVTWILGTPNTEALTLGNFLAFTATLSAFVHATFSSGNILLDIFRSIPAWTRVREILSQEQERTYVAPSFTPLKGDIFIENLQFSYLPDTPILKGIDLTIKPGEFIGIVGPSGCGKSTFLRLLIGFERPTKGSIRYNGIDLEQWDIHDFRSQLGCVLQNSTIIDGSILENIAAGRKLNENQIFDIIKMAGLEEFIEELPMGFHTHLSYGGVTISQGQMQRILIARALVNEPRILLLDEATSALDNITQKLITKNLEKLNISRIVVAHRESTLADANRVYAFSDGKLVMIK